MKFKTDLQLVTFCSSDYFKDDPEQHRYDAEVSATLVIDWRIDFEEKNDGLHGINPSLYSISGELEVTYCNEEGDPQCEEYIDIKDVIAKFGQDNPDFKIDFNPEIVNNQLYLDEIIIDFRDKTIEIT